MEWIIGIIVVLYLIGRSEQDKEQKETQQELEEMECQHYFVPRHISI